MHSNLFLVFDQPNSTDFGGPGLSFSIAEGTLWPAEIALGRPKGLSGQNRFFVCHNGILVSLNGVLASRIAFGSARMAVW